MGAAHHHQSRTTGVAVLCGSPDGYKWITIIDSPRSKKKDLGHPVVIGLTTGNKHGGSAPLSEPHGASLRSADLKTPTPLIFPVTKLVPMYIGRALVSAATSKTHLTGH